jgi:hypothetical protein
MAGTLTATTIQNDTTSPPTFRNSTVEIGTLCRAWVNFNGTGTPAIRASFNVSSITDNGTGDYTINFTTAFADANYTITGSSGGQNSTSNGAVYLADQATARTTNLFRIYLISVAGSLVDTPQINIAIFR